MHDKNTQPSCPPAPGEKQAPCSVEFMVRTIGGKWKMLVLRALLFYPTLRYNQLLAAIEGISPKELTRNLRELEDVGLVARRGHRGGAARGVRAHAARRRADARVSEPRARGREAHGAATPARRGRERARSRRGHRDQGLAAALGDHLEPPMYGTSAGARARCRRPAGTARGSRRACGRSASARAVERVQQPRLLALAPGGSGSSRAAPGSRANHEQLEISRYAFCPGSHTSRS